MKMERDEIYHYGILGMRWGVRRTPEQLGHRRLNKWELRKAARLESTFRDQASQATRMSDAERRHLRAYRNKCDNIANDMYKTAHEEANSVIRSTKFKHDLDNRLVKLFGSGVSDKELFDMYCRDCALDLLRTAKYSPNTNRLVGSYEDAYNEYYHEAEKIVGRAIKSFNEQANSWVLKKYQVDGERILKDTAWRNVPRMQDPYETYDAIYGNMEIDLSDVYSMREYNQRHAS